MLDVKPACLPDELALSDIRPYTVLQSLESMDFTLYDLNDETNPREGRQPLEILHQLGSRGGNHTNLLCIRG